MPPAGAREGRRAARRSPGDWGGLQPLALVADPAGPTCKAKSRSAGFAAVPPHTPREERRCKRGLGVWRRKVAGARVAEGGRERSGLLSLSSPLLLEAPRCVMMLGELSAPGEFLPARRQGGMQPAAGKRGVPSVRARVSPLFPWRY